MWAKLLEQLAQEVIALYYVTPQTGRLPHPFEVAFDQYCVENNIPPTVETNAYGPHTARIPEEWDMMLLEVIKNAEHPLRGVLLLSIVYQMQWRTRENPMSVDAVTTLVTPWIRSILFYERRDKRNERAEKRYAKA